MKFNILRKKVDLITEQINGNQRYPKTAVLNEIYKKVPQEILLEMKEIGIEELPYSYGALKRFIDAETMDIHYNRHYKGYVKKLNKALENKEDGDLELEQIIKGISRFNKTVRDNAGGAFNHALFWKMLSPKRQRAHGKVYEKIKKDFGDFNGFRNRFETVARKRFGSGWVWLVLTKRGDLKIMSTANQDNPLMNVIKNGGYPILGLDLWEHAYYLKYKNKRDEYIKNFWNVINWEFVNQLYNLRTQKKVNESRNIKQVISEGKSLGCNRKQVGFYAQLFNKNYNIKNRYKNTIMSILKELFHDYWYDADEYGKDELSGVYDFEQPGRSVINKLNTNYTAFCTLVNDLNQYLKLNGIDPIAFNLDDKRQQLSELDRFLRYLMELRYRIFSPESETFKKVMSGLDINNRSGDKREVDAVKDLKIIFNTDEVEKEGGLGKKVDALGGVDAYVMTPEGKKTVQIKPLSGYEVKDGFVILYGTGNVAPYKTDYMAFKHNTKGTFVFDNAQTKIIDGKYVYPISALYNNIDL